MTKLSNTVVGLLDGTVVNADSPLIHPDDYGLLRGDGVFETTLAVDGVPRDLAEHLARLEVSAAMLDLVLPALTHWHRAIDAVLAQSAAGQLVLRLVATRGREGGDAPTCFVLAAAPSPRLHVERSAGISVLLLDRGFVGDEVAAMPWLLAGAKTLSYAMNMAARRYAEKHGADDVIFVGRDGRILEGPTATVVVARDGLLITPPVDGILAGVTVRRLFRAAAAAGWETETAPLTPADLDAADGLWLVSGVRLLAPVTAVDGRPRPIGPATAELAEILQVPGLIETGRG